MHCIYIYANPEKSFIKNYQVPWKMKSTYAGRKTSTLTLELKLRIGISCRPAGPQWAGWQRRRTWCCLGWLATIQPPKPERDRDINHCIDSHMFFILQMLQDSGKVADWFDGEWKYFFTGFYQAVLVKIGPREN